MRVATWNINNVVKRLDLLLGWLEDTRPDVVALQELKTPTADFPAAALRKAGYEPLAVGQRSWNGVALLGRQHEPLPVLTALPGDAQDKEARYVEAAIHGVLFGCLYLPNGNPWPGPKFDYKLRWFERMRARAAELWASGQPVVLLGDWNVVPTDADIYKPDTWRDNALLQPEPREAYAQVLAQGWTDALASAAAGRPPFTFWDYRRQRWERDAGLRIDHILVSAALQVVDAGVDREWRGRDNASDHAPVWAELQPARATSPKSSLKAKADTGEKPLARYNAKRDFSRTAEPAGEVDAGSSDQTLRFVIQKHWASRLHYDVRLELDGVMLSWAVPKGPSFDPALKQIAIHVEDHPISYNTFEGAIPKGEYGAGQVIVWDRGTWEPVGDPQTGLDKGKLVFKFHGQKLAGLWELVRISKPGEKKQEEWLLLKKRGDAWARPTADYDVIAALPDSVVAQPLGLLEDRDPRGATSSPRKTEAQVEADLRQSRKAALPLKLAPQLATAASEVPPGAWIVENRFDGHRLLARVDGQRIKLLGRDGTDWTRRLAPIANAISALGIDKAWLDGEIVVLAESGLPDRRRLQAALDDSHADDVQYFVFDLPFLDGRDLREVPLSSRRAALRERLDKADGDVVRFSESFDVPPAQMLAAACQMGLLGITLKSPDAPYEAGTSTTWLELACPGPVQGAATTRSRRTGPPQDQAIAAPRKSLKVTNPERVIDPTTGLRKVDLVHYYESIADWMLPHLQGRPVSLVRAPTGVTGELFFQKHPETRMPGLKELDPALWPGHSALLGVDTAESLVAAAQMNTVEFHTWNSRVERIDQPDRVIFDLDPGDGVTWKMLQEAAVLTRSLLADLGLESWLKTSGGKGLHVVVPLTPQLDYDVVKGFSQAVVKHMAKVIPSRFVAVMGGTNRVGKIFIDYLRNGHAQTTAAAFSARSRPGLGVSMPVAWEQLGELKGGAQWTIATAREHVSFLSADPWSGYWRKRQSLSKPMKALGYEPAVKGRR